MSTIKLVSVAILSYLLIRLVIKFTNNLSLLDIPNERSSHYTTIPSGAGIGFIGAIFSSTFIFEWSLLSNYWYIFLSIFLVFVVGVTDDRYEVSAKCKFLTICVSVSFLWYMGVSINSIGNWDGYEIQLVEWIALPFTMFALAGFTNALNLIDGIDGLSGCISIVILICFYLVGVDNNNELMVALSSFSIASLVAFVYLNWYPAKVFMGDSGSLTLGFIISLLGILSIEYIHPIVILYFTSIPILDTCRIMVQRTLKGVSPFRPDKNHIHHILVDFFDGNVKQTVVFLTVIQLVFSGIGFMLLNAINNDNSGVIAPIAFVIFLLIFVFFYTIAAVIRQRQSKLAEV